MRELQLVSKSWRVYAQSLPQQGYLGGDVYPYLRRHNPISYFSDVQPPSQLNMNIYDFSQLQTDFRPASFRRIRSSFRTPNTMPTTVRAGVPIATSEQG